MGFKATCRFSIIGPIFDPLHLIPWYRWGIITEMKYLIIGRQRVKRLRYVILVLCGDQSCD